MTASCHMIYDILSYISALLQSSCLGNPSPLQEGSRGICLGSSDGHIRQEAGEQLEGHLAVQWLTVPGSAPCI